MDYKIVLLFVVAVLNSIFSFFTLEGNKNTTNILFSLFTLTLALWALNIAFFMNTESLSNALIFANLYYVIAAAIPVLFSYFSIFFLGYRKPNKLYLLYIIPFFILLFLFIFNKNILLEKIFFIGTTKEVIFNNIYYILYTIYFVFYVLLSYYYLFKSYFFIHKKEEKIQLKFIIIGTIFAYILGMIFNLFLPFWGDYSSIWLGPLFTLIMVFSMGYAIMKHHLFNTRVIITELLMSTILVFTLIKILLSETLVAQIVSISLLILIVLFGYFLVRGVRKEVKARERVEKLAREISMANRKLRQLEIQKTEFVSIASHQLRTPLTAIKGYASMLLEGSFGKLPDEVIDVMRKIFKSSQLLVVIIEDFLMVSRIEQGRMQYNSDVINFRKLVEETVEEIRPDAINKNLMIQMYVEDSGDFYIRSDGAKIKQVVHNIIGNAVKYTKKGFIKILLSKNKEGGKLRVAVSDTGIGINKGIKSKLFDKFSKGKNKIIDSGIGLYVAKEIIKAHKGNIWVESKGDGNGSTFFIELDEVKKSLLK